MQRRTPPGGRPFRRAAVLVTTALVATLTGAALVGPGTAAGQEDTLRAAAADQGICVGTAGEAAYDDRDRRFGETLAREFCSITAENSMKWESLRPTRDTYDFAAADRLVELAESRGVEVRGHALDWHLQNPAWVRDAQWGRDEAIRVLTDHITTVVGRYRGRVDTWDVVNEAISFFGTRVREPQNPWQRMIGDDHWEIAFRAAEAADPDSEKCVNDDWNDWRYDSAASRGGPGDTGRQGFTVDDTAIALKRQGVPVDCVGIQLHTQIDDVHDTDAEVEETIDLLDRRMDRLAAAGIDVHITELDVRAPTPVDDGERARQAYIASEVTQVCVDNDNCTRLITWGTSDAESWIPGAYPGYGEALLFDADYQEKGLYSAVLDTLRGRSTGGGGSGGGSGGGGSGGGSGSSGTARSGTTSAELVAAGGYTSLWQYVTVSPNTEYEATIHVTGSGRTQLRVHDGDWGADLLSVDCPASADWTACSGRFTTGSGTRATFRITDSTSGGTLHVDDARLVPVTGGDDAVISSGFESANDWVVQSPFRLLS